MIKLLNLNLDIQKILKFQPSAPKLEAAWLRNSNLLTSGYQAKIKETLNMIA